MSDVCHRENGLDHQFLKLIAKCSSDNQRVHMKYVLNVWFGCGDRNGELIGKCRNETCDFIAIFAPRRKKKLAASL